MNKDHNWDQTQLSQNSAFRQNGRTRTLCKHTNIIEYMNIDKQDTNEVTQNLMVDLLTAILRAIPVPGFSCWFFLVHLPSGFPRSGDVAVGCCWGIKMDKPWYWIIKPRVPNGFNTPTIIPWYTPVITGYSLSQDIGFLNFIKPSILWRHSLAYRSYGYFTNVMLFSIQPIQTSMSWHSL